MGRKTREKNDNVDDRRYNALLDNNLFSFVYGTTVPVPTVVKIKNQIEGRCVFIILY